MNKNFEQIKIGVITGVIVLVIQAILQGSFFQKNEVNPPSYNQQPIIINIPATTNINK
jgi:hypothetical protein